MNNNENNSNSNVIINFGKKYTFGEMIDKLSENSTLSFVSNGVLYFKRKDKLLTTKYSDNIYDVAHAEPMLLNNEIILQSFYETNIYISDIVYEVNISEIKDLMLEGKIIMLCLNNRTWIINVEDNVVFLDYSEADGANEDNYQELFTEDVLTSLLDGQWYVIDEERCNNVL